MKYVLSLLFAFYNLVAVAQKEVLSNERQTMIQHFAKSAAAIKSLDCRFEQIKHMKLLNNDMKSSGVMYYSNGQKLRWSYTTPYIYDFVLNYGSIKMHSNSGTNIVDVRSSKIFQEIVRIMMGCITGKCLTNKDEFEVKMFTDGEVWIAQLSPKTKNLKSMYSGITLYTNTAHTMVTKVEMTEKSGDTTLIMLKDIKINHKIDEKVFSVN